MVRTTKIGPSIVEDSTDPCSYAGCTRPIAFSLAGILCYCDHHFNTLFDPGAGTLQFPDAPVLEEFSRVLRDTGPYAQPLILLNVLAAVDTFRGMVPRDLSSPGALSPYLNTSEHLAESIDIWRERMFVGLRTARFGGAPIALDFESFDRLTYRASPVKVKDIYLPDAMLYLVDDHKRRLMTIKKPYGDSVIDNYVFAIGVCGQREPDGSAIDPIRLYVVAAMLAPKEICVERGEILTNFLSVNLVVRPESLDQDFYEALHEAVAANFQLGVLDDSREIGSYAGRRLNQVEMAQLLGAIGADLSNILHRADKFDVKERVLDFFPERYDYLRPRTLSLQEHLARLGYPKLILDEGWNG